MEIQQFYEIQSHPEYVEYRKGNYPLKIYLDVKPGDKMPDKILLGTRMEYNGQALNIIWISHTPLSPKSC